VRNKSAATRKQMELRVVGHAVSLFSSLAKPFRRFLIVFTNAVSLHVTMAEFGLSKCLSLIRSLPIPSRRFGIIFRDPNASLETLTKHGFGGRVTLFAGFAKPFDRFSNILMNVLAVVITNSQIVLILRNPPVCVLAILASRISRISSHLSLLFRSIWSGCCSLLIAADKQKH
jgi:hypothetical protein